MTITITPPSNDAVQTIIQDYSLMIEEEQLQQKRRPRKGSQKCFSDPFQQAPPAASAPRARKRSFTHKGDRPAAAAKDSAAAAGAAAATPHGPAETPYAPRYAAKTLDASRGGEPGKKNLAPVIDLLGIVKALSKDGADLRAESDALRSKIVTLEADRARLAHQKDRIEADTTRFSAGLLAGAEARGRDNLRWAWKEVMREVRHVMHCEELAVQNELDLFVEPPNFFDGSPLEASSKAFPSFSAALLTGGLDESVHEDRLNASLNGSTRQSSSLVDKYHHEAAKRAEAEKKVVSLDARVHQLETRVKTLQENLSAARLQLVAGASPSSGSPGSPAPAADANGSYFHSVLPALTQDEASSISPLRKTPSFGSQTSYVGTVVRGILEERDPAAVCRVDSLLAEYAGREAHLVEQLCSWYGISAVDVLLGGWAALPATPLSPGVCGTPCDQSSAAFPSSSRAAFNNINAQTSPKRQQQQQQQDAYRARSPPRGPPGQGVSPARNFPRRAPLGFAVAGLFEEPVSQPPTRKPMRPAEPAHQKRAP
ncbi:hypothetical protein DIPPA_23866 [Diplonema papillatum]|nr:hypothetical protein DIPPA_23866 [Diplonema papillatum]